MRKISQHYARRLLGKSIYAIKKDGTRVTGKLVKVHQNRIVLEPIAKGKKVRTKALLPLVLFDLLAIGTLSTGFGAYGGFGGYGGYGGGFGGGGYGGGGYGGGYGCNCSNQFFY